MSTRTAPKHYMTEGFEHYTAAQQVFGLTDAKMAEKLGYSDTGPTGWRKAGAMPAVAARLCRALVAEETNGQNKVMLVRVTSEGHQAALEAMAKALGLEWTTI